MTTPSIAARRIAETLTDCQIPEQTPQHVAMRQARIDTEAAFLDRVAEAGGFDLNEVFRAMAVKHAREHMEKRDGATLDTTQTVEG